MISSLLPVLMIMIMTALKTTAAANATNDVPNHYYSGLKTNTSTPFNLLYPPPVGGLVHRAIMEEEHGQNSSSPSSPLSLPEPRSFVPLSEYFLSHPKITIKTAVITNAVPLLWSEEVEVEERDYLSDNNATIMTTATG